MSSNRIFRTLLVAAGFGLLVVLIAPTAQAATDSASLSVNMTIPGNCQISGSTLAFPVYNTNDLDALAASTTFAVQCTVDTTVSVDFGGNRNRTMRNGTSSLTYQVSEVAGGPALGQFGDRIDGVSVAGNVATDVPIVGTIPPGQPTLAGTYTDTVLMTLTF